MCMCLCVSISVCVCDVLNIVILSLAFMPNEPKSEKYKNVSVSMHACFCVYHISVCVWYVIYKHNFNVHRVTPFIFLIFYNFICAIILFFDEFREV